MDFGNGTFFISEAFPVNASTDDIRLPAKKFQGSIPAIKKIAKWGIGVRIKITNTQEYIIRVISGFTNDHKNPKTDP